MMKMFIASLCALLLIGIGEDCNSAEMEVISGESASLEGPSVIQFPERKDSSGVAPSEVIASPKDDYASHSEGMQPPSDSTYKKRSYTSITTSKPVIAITFDDGPNAQLTPKLLDMLKERGVHATFFVVGTNAAEYPDLLRRMVAEGHEIGNHSWDHPALTKMSSSGVKSQLDQTNDAIAKATGHPATILRPPYGATNAALDRRFNDEFGMKVILWSVDPQDWRYRNSERVANYIIANTKPGDIILAHDIHATTVAAMPKVLDALLAKGFQFVTVSQLLAMDEPAKATPRPEPTAPTQKKSKGKSSKAN